ncbi:LuxR family transcriptional regulator [Aquimarina sp. D1M17]|uniref:triple tyrosine motif-containing protein n=1 Tax=Aquimarina acroporae TaxID=2937283 RepID=UPI0020BE1551|nr:triple tyrosine motif-containing protein [Aquimarina acroporae]MCK8521292.1 LuxR family transcriptional regulator [Aquimarina acroporae]
MTFLPETYNAGTQNWAITQSDSKYIYVANEGGLLEYNGTNWKLYSTPNGTNTRSVNVVGDRVYTGSYMNFGYWKKNNFGNLKYTSLSDIVKDKLIEDEQFWKIVHLQNWVLFQSLNRIYIYNDETEAINFVESNTGIVGLYNVNGVIYFQDPVKGIYKIEEGKPRLVTDFAIAQNDKVVSISKISNGILVLTSSNGFFTVSKKGVQKWNIPADDSLEGISIFSSIRLIDGSFILGTISEGVIYLSEEGTINYKINQSQGLSNNTVLSMFEDADNNIWLGLDNGINCINIKSPIELFDDVDGTIGTVYTSVIFNNVLYLGTNQGLFYKSIGLNEEFKFVKGTNGQVWSLYVYDDSLFCGHDSGTFLIDYDNAQLISNLNGGWVFKPIAKHPDKLLQGTYTGLCVLHKNEGKWELRHKIEGFEYSARFIELFEDSVWVNHENKGVFKIKLDEDFKTIVEIETPSLVERGKNSNVIEYKGDILYSHEQGLYVYNASTGKFEKGGVTSQFSNNENHEIGKLIKDNNGKLWSFSKNNISYIEKSQFSKDFKITRIPIPRSLRKEMFGFENIMFLGKDKYLIGTTRGYLILNTSKNHNETHQIILDKIWVKDKKTAFKEVSRFEKNPVFAPNFNTFSFAYTIPEYDKYMVSKFEYKLEGFYDFWSNWTTNSKVVFENLPYGEYSFLVRAKTGNIPTNNVARFDFTIKRPWYVSVWAIIIYALLFLFILFLMHKLYKRYYTRQKQKLIEENRKQLELKRLESEKEIMKLNNEKLTQDIENKNRELATSTMNIIKKNEILNTIKKELQKSEMNVGGVKNVERIINRNLNNEDDWKHFEEAFNNVDKDFLKKLKAKHNDLTPHDLRFCTYLRLNLSSKEIAPLLNISVRSVEIKRYRLRKKLKLEHSDNLVNYILEI